MNDRGNRSGPGSLTVVGTGITYYAHLTNEARAAIKAADKVLYLVADPATDSLIRRLNRSAESLQGFYGPRKDRIESYEEMADEIVTRVRNGLDVCVVFYGHPGVFVFPSHRAIEQARDEGFPARMLPAISAEDCLFADLGVDPGMNGCQSFEATDFLIHQRSFDPTSVLLLWQVGALGRRRIERSPSRAALELLSETLASIYGDGWRIVLYEGAQFPGCDPMIERTTLRELPGSTISPFATLYVPPMPGREPHPAILERIGLRAEQLSEMGV